MAEEKILERIRKILERAQRTNHDGERETAFALADKLMREHQIEQAELDMKRSDAEKAQPVAQSMVFSWFKFLEHRTGILVQVAEHYRCRLARHASYRFTIVGMQHDVEMVEMFYTMIEMEFLRQIEPSWDKSLPFDENVYNLHGAGKKWVEIAFMANANGGNPRTGRPGSTRDGSWLLTAYRRECAKRGEEPRRQTQRHNAWRDSFATSFEMTIGRRLRQMRRSTEESTGEAGKSVALLTSDERVRNAFYEKFPNLHPDYQAQKIREAQEEWQKWYDAMTPAEQAAYERKQEREREQARRREDARWRSSHDDGGWKAGSKAAERVDLSGGRNHVGSNRKELEL